MRTRNRDPREEDLATAPQPAASEPGGEDPGVRARRLADVGDEVIQRALSRDSQRFVTQNRQQGGE